MAEENSERAADKLRMLGSIFCATLLPKLNREELLQMYILLKEIAAFDPALVTADEIAEATAVHIKSGKPVPQNVAAATDDEAGRFVIDAFATLLTSITDDYRVVVQQMQLALEASKEERVRERQLRAEPMRIYTSDRTQVDPVLFPTMSDRTT